MCMRPIKEVEKATVSSGNKQQKIATSTNGTIQTIGKYNIAIK